MTSELGRLRESLPGRKIVVVGDVCLDWYLFIDSSHAATSVETGKLTRPVRTSRYSPGGAGNVAANLASLGVGRVVLVGVVGADPFAEALEATLAARGISSRIVVQEADWHTSVYTKLYEHDEEDRRIDFGDFNKLSDSTRGKVIDMIDKEIDDCDLLVVNQQLIHGLNTPEYRRDLVTLIADHPDLPVITDSRDFPAEYDGTIRKLNEREASLCLSSGEPDASPDDFAGAADIALALERRWEKPVIVTRGAYGCIVARGGTVEEAPGIEIGPGQDIVGAGDAFLAGFGCALASGSSFADSARIANLAAAVTVTKRFETGTATIEEIGRIAAEPVYRYRPDVAFGRGRRWFETTEIEVITRRPERRFVSAVFDHDGTISTLRQGWERVMEPMMIEAITGGADVGPDRSPAITKRVREYIDATTGIQTIAQMTGLVALVEEFALVPKNGILSPASYKALYNTSLMEVVEKRTAKLVRGELSLDDVTMKGAVRFLESLRSRGITLYLASGTDEADVRAEAELLGYAQWFDGGIYGATGSIDEEPKKRALERILSHAGSVETVVAFGDGPVEMRETVRRGGYSVGVASDEVRRYGHHPDKRKRLVLAGADAIIPDFSQGAELIEFLFGGASGGKR